jgi:indole-3-glycerol phosphate synthase
MSDILTEIIQQKRLEVAQAKLIEPEKALLAREQELPPPLDFAAALRKPRFDIPVALIAEIKKASPSKGLIAPDFDVEKIAGAYSAAGASAMSVLTDEKFFQGHLSYIEVAKKSSGGHVPILRKDFIIDEYQVLQARAYGADAILLIMAALDDATATMLQEKAQSFGLGVLVEVHDVAELQRALSIGADIIGINNRNLHTFEVDLQTTTRLVPNIPPGKIIVSESGIARNEDIALLAQIGVHAALVGESLMRAASTARGLDIHALQTMIHELFRNAES